jgi:hypothetical protein
MQHCSVLQNWLDAQYFRILRFGYSEFFRSVTDGVRQRPEAANAQMNGTLRTLYPHMHDTERGPAIITVGAFFCREMNEHWCSPFSRFDW